METKDRGYFAPANAREWFEKRSYSHEEFKDVEKLARRKRELGLTVSLVLPSRNVADTIGGIVERTNALNEEAPLGTPLVDQTLVVDADSGDGTAEVATARGAEVYSENELLSHYGGAHGKGDAMWRSLSVARGDLVMFADADTKDFLPQFVYGTLGPVISLPGVRFVKGAFRRPFKSQESLELDGGGRVTELTTKPLFNLFYPELTGFVQPLAGEFVADKELFSSIPFLTGYAVETGVMIDVYKKVGLGAMAQVDLGTRQNRHQALRDLGAMAYAVLATATRRFYGDEAVDGARGAGALAVPSGSSTDLREVSLEERPPLRTLPAKARGAGAGRGGPVGATSASDRFSTSSSR